MTSTLFAPARPHLPANDELSDAIRQHAAGWRANPAMRALIGDYTLSHELLVAVGGVFVVGLAALSIVCWRRWRRAPRQPEIGSPERRLMRALTVTFTLACLALGLIVAANLSTAADPLQGFLQASAHPTPNSLEVDGAVTDWVRSGANGTPAIVQAKVDDRVDWQLPKAIICGLLLVAFGALAFAQCRRLVRRSRTGEATPRRRERWAPMVTVCAGLLMMVMFIANLQNALAPLTITVLGGS